MKDENEFEIRLNEHGEPDVDFYMARAHRLRSEAVATGFQGLGTWFVEMIDRSWFPNKGQTAPRRRVVTQSEWPWVDLILQSTPDRTRRA